LIQRKYCAAPEDRRKLEEPRRRSLALNGVAVLAVQVDELVEIANAPIEIQLVARAVATVAGSRLIRR